jgi:hypothetical protein
MLFVQCHSMTAFGDGADTNFRIPEVVSLSFKCAAE